MFLHYEKEFCCHKIGDSIAVFDVSEFLWILICNFKVFFDQDRCLEMVSKTFPTCSVLYSFLRYRLVRLSLVCHKDKGQLLYTLHRYIFWKVSEHSWNIVLFDNNTQFVYIAGCAFCGVCVFLTYWHTQWR